MIYNSTQSDDYLLYLMLRGKQKEKTSSTECSDQSYKNLTKEFFQSSVVVSAWCDKGI